MTASALSLVFLFALTIRAQTPATPPSPSPTPCAAPITLTLKAIYKKGAEPYKAGDAVTPLTRKRFYLSTKPFNLDGRNLGAVPTRESYYKSVGASPELINWLETNNCDTIFCRELELKELTCKTTDKDCVREFVDAYAEALRQLKKPELARRWVTNYGKLSSPELSTGFYLKKKQWLDGIIGKSGKVEKPGAVRLIEQADGLAPGAIRTAMTDMKGEAYFYGLCPNSYYVSSIAPVEVEGESFIWDTAEIILDEMDNSKTPFPITLANVKTSVAEENDLIFFTGKKIPKVVSAVGRSEEKPSGQ
ncbi:MAG TPA: hypothetical protein VF791_20025 [Pyrinomonadaceae bacterium]